MKFEEAESNSLSADLVVIGGGGSGLAAALTAAEKGLTDIIVLEQLGGLGGNTAIATGLFACESPVQARERIVADKDELFHRAMEWSHWSRINPRLIRAFLNKSGDTIHWLEEKGLEFNIIPFFPNQEPRVWHVAKGKGAALTRVLAEKCRQKGVRIINRSRGKKILRGVDGKITGVLAVNGDQEVEIATTCVIIATGGFVGNKEMLKQYCPEFYEGMPVRGLPHHGDGLLMAAEVGAVIDNMVGLLIEGPRVDLHGWPLQGLERQPETLWVNKRGERFADESTGDHPFVSVKAILQQPDKVCFTLLDSAAKEKMAERIPDLEKYLEIEVAKNRVKISDSWDELAGWMGADPGVIETTVREYNDFCDHGYDQLFAKERRYLWPLHHPPYYAIKGMAACLDTLGGIKINDHMQVLDSRENPIPGIYAAGVITSGWQSVNYSGDLSGSAFGYAVNSGRIGGEHAAEYLLGKNFAASQK